MSLRLTLVAHAATAATRRSAFPMDEGLEPRAYAKAAAMAPGMGRVDAAWSAPSLRTRQTAEALGLVAPVNPVLADINLGHWAGCSLAEVTARNPDGLAHWMMDPTAAPHGGESVMDLLARLSPWLEAMHGAQGRIVVITHAAVIRAIMIIVLDANPHSFWRIDVEPLCFGQLQSHQSRWTVRSLGQKTPNVAT